jgi:type IV secretory pathway VirB2 component (pilin)
MKKYIFILLFSLLIVPNVVSANFLGPIGNPMCSGLGEYSTRLCNLLWEIQSILYILAGSIAVLFIIIAGLMYMTAGESEDKTKQAKKMIINALIGVAIVMSCGFLIGIVREILSSTIG